MLISESETKMDDITGPTNLQLFWGPFLARWSQNTTEDSDQGDHHMEYPSQRQRKEEHPYLVAEARTSLKDSGVFREEGGVRQLSSLEDMSIGHKWRM